jgi:hypothetical protein
MVVVVAGIVVAVAGGCVVVEVNASVDIPAGSCGVQAAAQITSTNANDVLQLMDVRMAAWARGR